MRVQFLRANHHLLDNRMGNSLRAFICRERTLTLGKM
jgi:hypothetical protein